MLFMRNRKQISLERSVMPSILCRESMMKRSRRMLGFTHRWQDLENFRQTQNYRVCNAPQDGFQMIRQITMHAVISGAE